MLEKSAILGGHDGVDEMGGQKIDGDVGTLPTALSQQAAIARQNAHERRALPVAQLDRVGNGGVEESKCASKQECQGKPEVNGGKNKEAHLPGQAPKKRALGAGDAAGALWRWPRSLTCSRPTHQSHACRQSLSLLMCPCQARPRAG